MALQAAKRTRCLAEDTAPSEGITELHEDLVATIETLDYTEEVQREMAQIFKKEGQIGIQTVQGFMDESSIQ